MSSPAKSTAVRAGCASHRSWGGSRSRFWLAFSLFFTLGAAAPALLAQVFPTRTVKITMPHSPGVAPSIFMRLIAEKLSKQWGRQVVVENKPGASGFIAIESVKNAARDGHELLAVANSHMTINPSLYSKLPYDPEKDFVPVAMVMRASF